MSRWLVVGLGNPGPTYASHRHNVGAMVVAELSRRARSTWSSGKGLRADLSQTRITPSGIGAVGADADTVVLVRSRTFMNESGLAVGKTAKYFQVPAERIVVVHDELDLDFGRLRLKLGGGDNGHNGLRSIRASLGTGDFLRVRVGIGRPPGRQDPADFVLSGFPKALTADLDELVDRAADAVEALLLDGLATAQNRFNS
ncbi:aminoacyl-tRNA hydrolase [Propionicicella superfundia]|uniref:aminoacyl-tRNA hydrolase n=1 Tax=Propionicicella superfundia TaxID=348582 RepID=UPI00041A051F|nr:aminoacyl-tRNA hydrolase [Propionicicella superfundia]